MQSTTNYGLKKPELTDNVKISDFNENADIVDTQLKARADAQTAHVAAADPHTQYALDTDLSNLAGAGRTTETVKGISDAVAAHQADLAPHGSTSAAAASKLIIRDVAGRAKVAAPSASDDIARKDTVDNAIAALVNSSPTTLDTLKELADALGDDPNYATTTATLIGTKETPAGAQAKADAVQTNLTAHSALYSTETVSGHVKLATATETTTGTDNTRAVHPLGLKSATNLLVPLTKLTWEKIAEQTLVSSVVQVDFTSIPSGYKDFKIIYDANSIGGIANLLVRLNNDSSTNYRYEELVGGTTAGAAGTINSTSLVLTSGLSPTGAACSFGIIEISNFNSLKAKRIIAKYYSESNATPSTSTLQIHIVGGVWNDMTNEINQISLIASVNQLAIGNRFVLWGCK